MPNHTNTDPKKAEFTVRRVPENAVEEKITNTAAGIEIKQNFHT
jgi:hypothetical protein